MQHLDLNAFITEVHQNAIEHGWWDKPRSAATIRSLFHSELSEAVESYRKSEPLHYHLCPGSACACEKQPVHEMENLHCEACTPADRKPEGGAVELMDFVIRVFDYLGQLNETFDYGIRTAEELAAYAVDDFQSDEVQDVLALDELSDFADVLHDEIALSHIMHNITYLQTAAGLALAWVEKRGLDPVALLLEKHEYNKIRSYKHGGKVI